jgi:predicted esterase
MEDWWTWPNGVAAQAENEKPILDEWARAKALLEEKSGKPFERVWVFGFSNGAYYATSLALRGRLSATDAVVHVDGFASFAGGSGEAYLERAAKAASTRTPLFVAWGGKDKAHPDQVKLSRMLKRLRWPTASEGAPRAGHVMTDHQAASAIRFLDGAKALARPRR